MQVGELLDFDNRPVFTVYLSKSFFELFDKAVVGQWVMEEEVHCARHHGCRGIRASYDRQRGVGDRGAELSFVCRRIRWVCRSLVLSE